MTARPTWIVLSAVVMMTGSSCGSGPASRDDAGLPPGGPKGAAFSPGPLPGAPAPDARLLRALENAWASRSAGYEPRTRHLTPDGAPRYANRLFLESSPYLLQHAHNPVNWYPWGDEAFEAAARLGRPVFLSVGYSTCHWCHVMEEESFEDEEIARFLNEHFISIKVDREERPDVDGIYMTAVQLTTGRGGWPMSVWLTPDREPFYGGTYFPARDGDRGATLGFLTILRRLHEIYVKQPAEITGAATRLSEAIRNRLEAARPSSDLAGPEILERAFKEHRDRFDPTYGGAQGSPKFPSSFPVRLLLHHHRRTGDPQARNMATVTLERMAAGGIHDQIGGGFHRYSTDERWLVPHFEKMLYDNALLAVAYLDGYQATGRADFARVAREILRYADRDMSAPEGGFYSATDADSPRPTGAREEGWFFTWTPRELEEALGKERAHAVGAYYGVSEAGNFEGRSILHRTEGLEQAARRLRMPARSLERMVDDSRPLLYAARSKRPPPHRDEKIVTAWNGLMIGAYSRGALALGEPVLARRAERAAAFLLERVRVDGRLKRSFKDGRTGPDAFLEDYAFLIGGLLDLYEATARPRWLEEAIALDAVLERDYEDKKEGGFFLTGAGQAPLLAREKPSLDGAEPSGNSVQTLNLLRLAEFTTESRYRARAERALRALDARLEESPAFCSELLLAVDFHLDLPKEVMIVTPRSREDAEPFLAELRRTYLPNRVLAVATEGKDLAAQARIVPLLEGKTALRGRTTAYVCEAGVCKLPTTDPHVFADQIRSAVPREKVP